MGVMTKVYQEGEVIVGEITDVIKMNKERWGTQTSDESGCVPLKRRLQFCQASLPAHPEGYDEV
jgi:hypothetical protein